MKREELIEQAVWRCERMIRTGVNLDEVKAQICVSAFGISRQSIVTIDTMILAMDMYFQFIERTKKEKL